MANQPEGCNTPLQLAFEKAIQKYPELLLDPVGVFKRADAIKEIAQSLGLSTNRVSCVIKEGKGSKAILDAAAKYPKELMAPPGSGGKKSGRSDAIRAIAAEIGSSTQYVHSRLELLTAAGIGQRIREEEASKLVPVLEVEPPDLGMLSRNFKGWRDVFTRLQILVNGYLQLAGARGDVYAAAFLKDIREQCERGQERADKAPIEPPTAYQAGTLGFGSKTSL